MVKTLVLSSNTPEEDRMAAFMIQSEATNDRGLEKVVWYSNLGDSFSEMQTQMAMIQADMKTICKVHDDLTSSQLKMGDRLLKLEKTVNTKCEEKK